jgi:heavy metal efflux system protein
MRKLIFFAVHQPLLVFLILLLFLGVGVAAFNNLPIEAFPDVTDIQVTVVTLYPGQAAEEVEKQVTIPLEIALSGLPHAVRLFSHTQFGLSSTYITFDDESDNYFARQQVIERLQNVDLPEGVKPELAPLSSPIGEIYRVYLKSETKDAMELRTLMDWVVQRHLKMVPGVADVVPRGGLIKQFQVVPDFMRMRALGVDLEMLIDALKRGNLNAGGGYIELGEQQLTVRAMGLLRSRADIERVVVTERNGVPVVIADVAAVEIGFQQRQGMVALNDNDSIVNGTILMRKGETPALVLAGVKAKIDELNTSILPKDVLLVPYYDRAWLIGNTLKTVFKNLAEGAGLVCIVLFLFLGRVAPAAIVAIVIPLSLLATFIGLTVKGIPANLLSLGAMDFGIIVDGAVIVVENIFRTASHDRDKYSSFKELVAESAAQVGRPTFFSMLIIILAHLPIFALQRHEGRIFAPMAYTITSALIGSLLFSLTLVPVLCVYLMKRTPPEHENFLVRFANKLYRGLLQKALARPLLVLSAAGISLAGSLALLPRLGSEFLPELNEGSIWINFTLPPGIAPTEVSRSLHTARATLMKIPEVSRTVSQAGRPDDGTDPKTFNMAEVLVDLKPESDWRPGKTKEDIIAEMEKALDGLPGITPTFSQPIRDSVLESISQIDGQIVIKMFGDDSEILKREMDDLLKLIKPIRGVGRAFVDRAGRVPQLRIEVDRDRAAKYGLNIADIEDVIETALGGHAATQIWEGEKRFDVVVRLRDADRNNVDALRELLIEAPDHSRVPLDQVAKIGVHDGILNISREGGRATAAIGVFLKGRDMGSLVAEMQEVVNANLKLPPGYTLTWGGEFENQQRAMKRLFMIIPVSILLIFVLLFEAFKSVKSAALILLNVPFALVGGILALFLTGIHLSVSAAIGFIALFGQAVLNGVVMVSHFDQLRQAGRAPYLAVFDGAQSRLRTVLMTSLLAMLGLLPMALSHAIGSEVQRPLAVVIIGGLVSATVLTLFVLPALYLMFHAGPDKADI